MYEGKDFFTVYDFVKAHHNFADPEWDGEPLAPEPCADCGNNPCNCAGPGPRPICEKCGQKLCICQKEPPPPCPDCGQQPCQCERKIEIRLGDGKARQIRHISSVMYWSADGKPITAREFLERMFDDLPRFFRNEDELRALWSDPDTREKLLADLADGGYDSEKLEAMKGLIEAEDSDVYDMLAYVAYARTTHTRMERVTAAKPAINQSYPNYKLQQFIEFVLDHYVEGGVSELSPSKLKHILELRYNTISDSTKALGSPAVIRETFVGFQKHLYDAFAE
jgi:type I restriction enzyme R subunit